jgi:dTDP-glucose 4,6-dehydratase
MSKKVLVTGGSGFIGSNLVKELKSRGHNVWLCDLLHSEKENFIRCDVGKYHQVERLLTEHDFDFVYHAAWVVDGMVSYYENLATNALAQKILVQEKKKFRMIFFGSAEVYGDYNGVMREDVMDKIPIKQMNDYAISKWVTRCRFLIQPQCMVLRLLGCAYSTSTESESITLLIGVGFLSSSTKRCTMNLTPYF